MPLIEATINRSQLRAAERTLRGIKNGVARASTRAVNKVARSARSDVVKQISKATGLKQKDIRKFNTKLTLANFKHLVARLLLVAKAISLTRLKPRQTRRGVTYSLGGKRILLPGAFIPAKKDGSGRKWPVFKRRSAARLPIDKQFGPNPLDSVDVNALQAKVTRNVGEEFDRQVGVLLEQAARA